MNDTAPIYGIINGSCDDILLSLLERGVKYDLILTDPPYNVGKDFGNNSDNLPLDTFLSQMYTRIDLLSNLLSPKGSIYGSVSTIIFATSRFI